MSYISGLTLLCVVATTSIPLINIMAIVEYLKNNALPQPGGASSVWNFKTFTNFKMGGGGGGVTQKNPTPTLEKVRLG